MYSIDEAFEMIKATGTEDITPDRNFWDCFTNPNSNILFVGGTEFYNTTYALSLSGRSVDSIALTLNDFDRDAFIDLVDYHTHIEEEIGIESTAQIFSQDVKFYNPGKTYDVIVLPNTINAPINRKYESFLADPIIKLSNLPAIWLILNSWPEEKGSIDRFLDYSSKKVKIKKIGTTLQGDVMEGPHEIYLITSRKK